MDDGSGKDAASLNMDDFSDYIHQYGPLIATFQRNHSGAIAKPATSDVDAEAHVAECYAKVPRIFFASNFNLRDPAIFAAALNSGVVVENNTGTGTGTGGGVDDDEALSESAAPQQHGRRQPGGGSSEEEASMKVLSGHLETTELSLLSLVSSRSDSFFSQLQNLQVFREQITSTCHAIVDTRVSLDNIRKRFVAGNIRVPHLTRRRSGLQKVQHLVQLILQVQQTQQIVQANLEEGHFGAALDTIEAAQVALQGPLAAIGSLRSVRVQLDSFVKLIANTMASRFLDLAVSMNVLVLDDALPSSSFDDDADAAATTTITTANDAEAAAENAQLSRRVAFKEKILPLVKGLVRVGQLRQVMAKYRGRLTEVVTLVVRTAVSASLEASNTAAAKSGGEDDDDDDSAAAGGDGASAANAKNGRAGSRKSNPGANGKFPSVVTKLRSLNDQEFQSMLKDVLDHLMSVVSQAASVHAMLLVALEDTRDDSDAAGDESPRTDGRVVESRRESASTLRQKSLQRDGCERDSREALEHMWRIAQRHIGRMFDIREKELAAQPLSKQKALWDMVSSFVTRAQKKCGRRGDTLLNTLMAQVKKYLEHSHARLRGRLEHALTHDGWGEAQILPSHAETLRAITCYANGVDPAAAAAGANGSTETGGDGAAGIALSSSLANANPNAPLKRLHFQGEDYHVPGCVLELLAAIQVHLQCTQDFSAHVTTIMHQILELLSLYNQRTTDLILGTGALALYVGWVCIRIACS